MGVTYMQNFLANCTSCQIDAVALVRVNHVSEFPTRTDRYTAQHWYDAAWNTGYFFNYMNGTL